MAIQFIKKCCSFANSISFILPKSFKKDSMKKHFPLNYHLIFEMDLPENAFLINNKETDVPCIFQIWQYKTEKHSRNWNQIILSLSKNQIIQIFLSAELV